MEALSELQDLLKSLGDESPSISISKIAGLLLAYTSLDPFEVVERVRELSINEPYRISMIQRLIPVEEVVATRPQEIAEAVERLARKIPEEESFRITVEKRHTNVSSREIINQAASRVNRRVNLERPDWVVLIEVLGPLAGVSVIKPDQVISMAKQIKPGEGEEDVSH